jgi:hypothetical protein
MRKAILMSNNEPNDIELKELMHEVAIEVKRKALITQSELSEQIKKLLLKAIIINGK